MFFFFSWIAHHRHLPSFPTRPSSNLATQKKKNQGRSGGPYELGTVGHRAIILLILLPGLRKAMINASHALPAYAISNYLPFGIVWFSHRKVHSYSIYISTAHCISFFLSFFLHTKHAWVCATPINKNENDINNTTDD